jgi:transcriptional regulator with PAS, ATPase and Fis domain
VEIQSIKQRFGIIGNSPGLNYAIGVAQRVGPTELTVLITGESGVGKEIFSQIIHHLSPRKHNPFIAVNCGAIPEGTIDSELFGHEKGSFTGATEARKGYFETVNGGTIFLDEISEMPTGTQARLLRVLETGEFIRVGSSKVQKTDVRVIAATNVDLFERVNNSRFREDLYYRLNTVPIRIPPLRDRREDIHLLFRKFASDFADKYRSQLIQLDDEAVNVLENYRWPGNIRELKNLAEQISVLAPDRVVTAAELRRFIPKRPEQSLPMVRSEAPGGEFTERDILYRALFEIRKDIHDVKDVLMHMTGNGTTPVHEEHPALESSQPIVIGTKEKESEDEIEESLSLSDMEKEYIIKALRKHKNKRRDAAFDLGISERTLYRKIQEYGLE